MQFSEERRSTERQYVGGIYTPPKEYEGVNGARYYLIQTVPQLKDMLRLAKEQKYLAIDTEGNHLNWVLGIACGVSIGWGLNHNYYVPFAHRECLGEYDGPTSEKQLSQLDVVNGFNNLFADPDKVYFMANAKHDIHVLMKEGMYVKGVYHDIITLSYLLDENGSHGVKELAVRHVHPEAGKWEKELKLWRQNEAKRRRSYVTERAKQLANELKKDEDLVLRYRQEAEAEGIEDKRKITVRVNQLLKKQATETLKELTFANKTGIDDVSYDYVPLDIMAPYACSDVHYTLELGFKFLKEVTQEKYLKPLYIKENRLGRALTSMEWGGMKVDRNHLEDIGPDLQKIIDDAKTSMFREVGKEFNPGSTDQILQIIEEKGIKLTKLTKGSLTKLRKGEITEGEASYAADTEVLERLAVDHQWAKLVLEFREAEKLKGTYRDGILELLDPYDLVHTSFNPNVKTGRMSSRSPNLQNQPGGTGGKLIRKAFIVPDNEYVFIFIDYSQIELRILAHLSQDPNLMACYPWEGEGIDVHTKTAAEAVLEMSVEEFLKVYNDQNNPLWEEFDFARKAAKRVNFGIGYGANKYTIQRQIATPDRPVEADTCQGYIDGFFNNYKYVKKLIARTNKFLHRHGYVQNEAGRYRRFPEIPAYVEEMEEIKYRKDPESRARKKDLFPRISRAERQANNFLIQGYAADIFKESVVRVNDLLRGKKSRICNLVHDEMQFYFHKSELGLLKEVKRVMEDYSLSVPLKASVAYSATNWSEKRELKLAA